MLAKRSAQQSVAQKVFVRSTKAGGAIKVFREQYVRDDIPCGSAKCPVCASKSVPDFRGNVVLPSLSEAPRNLPKIGPHYLIVDTNVCLKAIDLLEQPDHFQDIIVPSVVLEEVRNRSISVYTRLRALVSGGGYSKKRFYVFHNEFNTETHIDRQPHESVNDYNDRAIRRVAEWYNQHLDGVVTILLTNDRLNLESSLKLSIPCSSLHDYIKELGDMSLLDFLPTSEDLGDENRRHASDSSRAIYSTHLSTSRVLGGLKGGTLHQGKFSISTHNYLEGKVSAQGFDRPLLVVGRDAMNRAFDGDRVVVEILPKKSWRRPLTELADEAQDNDEVGDDESETITTEKERILLAEDAKLSQKLSGELNAAESPKPTCRIVSIVKRNWRFYVGQISSNDSEAGKRDSGALRSVLVQPMDKRIPKIRIKTRRANELSGQRIVVAVDDWPIWSRSPEGHFIRNLGKIEDHQAETEAILLEHDIEYRPFPRAAMDCLPEEGENWVPDCNATNRRDLRHLNICSIDPPRCQDIDDALHAHELPNGNYSVGVHIADVTHFVKADTPLDKEGGLRATSTYLVDRRIDMLPSLLGTNLCSLRPFVERYAFSVLWEMTPDGDIVSTEFTKSLIKSRQAFEYEEAQMKIDDASQQDELAQSMRILLKLSKLLKQKRMDAGALNLASPEVKIHTGDEMNDPTSVEIKKPVATNSLVEEFMLLANISVARKIYEFSPQTALLRRHGAPPATNFEVLNDQLRLNGFKTIRLDSSKTVAESLDEINNPQDPFFNTLVRIMATRCMMAAEYFPAGDFSFPEFRHYGLASEIYTHFTSPIRRYADVVVHRQLAAAIDYENLPPSHFVKSNLDSITDNINIRHRNAQFAGRASVEYYVGQMLKKQDASQLLEGYVVKVFSNGVSILVPKYGLESVVRVEDICEHPEHDAELDEDNFRLRLTMKDGKKRTLSIFEKLNVLVSSVRNEATGKRFVRMTLG